MRRTAHIQSAEDQQNLHLAAIRKKAVWRVSKRDLACFWSQDYRRRFAQNEGLNFKNVTDITKIRSEVSTALK